MFASAISRSFATCLFPLALVGWSSQILQAIPVIYDIPWATGTLGSRGLSINDSAQVAVTSYELLGQGTASRYDGIPGSGGVLRNLGALPGDQHGFANAINAHGQVAGTSQQSGTTSPARAFRYDGTPGSGGIMHNLGTLGGNYSEAFGINDFGQVTGTAATDPNGPNPGQFAFLYTGTPGAGGMMHNLGALGGSNSTAAAINNTGQVAGSYEIAAGGISHAFRYDGPAGFGIMRDLEPAADFSSSSAADINAGGQVVGSMATADGSISRGFVYSGTPGVNGVIRELDPLPGATLSFALAITDSGYVLGGSDDASGLYILPVLWRPDGVAIDLEAWLDVTDPVLGQDWNFKNAFVTSISNSGLIAGDATYVGPGTNNGRQLAFVLDVSSLVPEPNMFLLLAAVLLVQARRAIRFLGCQDPTSGESFPVYT